ncbi:MAG: ribosome small subunit-dependent GTPase A [Candidatus Eremiobacteraeota bacterium]|nr:ribosome small subunit-dependent GTPase A [Candidatus Eremiobacteraeota bacterium]
MRIRLVMNDGARARVVSVGKNAVWVMLDNEQSPRVASLKRMSGKRSMVVPGDVVDVRVLDDGKALLERVHPRDSVLERRTVEGKSKTMAANVDAMVTVTALADPPPRLSTLDQLLAFCEFNELYPIVVLTKPDLAAPSERGGIEALYRALGYETLVVSPKFGEGMPELRDHLAGRHAMLAGVSGVGKSSIFRWLGGQAVVGDVSRFGLGRQTTSVARLYRLADGFLIDSPGVAEFGLGALTAEELVEGFRELAEPARHCRFNDCTHVHEPDCGVHAAVRDGRVAESRYDSYRRILQEQR